MVDIAGLAPWLDLAGTFVFGLSGGTLAVRKRLDIFGVMALSVAAALAGGMIRDALLGATPAAALADDKYLLVAATAGLVSFLVHPMLERLGKPVMVFDAMGLGLFAVTGCRKALDYGLEPAAAVLLGVMTAVGGGLVRDLLVAEVPRVLREEIYALTGAAIACGLRIVSVYRGWSAPRAPWS